MDISNLLLDVQQRNRYGATQQPSQNRWNNEGNNSFNNYDSSGEHNCQSCYSHVTVMLHLTTQTVTHRKGLIEYTGFIKIAILVLPTRRRRTGLTCPTSWWLPSRISRGREASWCRRQRQSPSQARGPDRCRYPKGGYPPGTGSVEQG